MICVTEKEVEIIMEILRNYLPKAEVRVFGSRYKGTNGVYSDLDIAIITEQKISLKDMALICEAFEESELPFRVDILDYNAISPSFRAVINEGYDVLYGL